MAGANDNDESSPIKTLKQIKGALMDGSEKKPAPRRRARSAGDTISINGDRNTVINGDNITTIHTPAPIKTVVKVQTGVGVLTAAQKSKINSLIKEWAEARDAVRKTKAEIAALRSAFNKAMGVNSYHEIKQENFERAMVWLRRQTGIINSMASAPKKNPNWRTQRYRSINARAKEFPDGEVRYRLYAEERFGSSSLRDLNDEQLDAVYRYVFGWSRIQK